VKKLHELTIKEARRGLLNREFSSFDLTKACIVRAKRFDTLNSFVTLLEEQALKDAEDADKKIAAGDCSKPLLGIPIAIKDIFCTRGILTTAGSKMLSNFIPSYDSTVTEKLKSDGAIFVGKTNMDEFAMGSSNCTSYFGPSTSPYRDRSRPEVALTPGGSSGGSSAAVAANFCISSIGSDTGGSVRQPAAFTGMVGIKPTYGLCSRFGMIPFASSLDHPGPITKDVTDAAIMLGSMAGYDEKDSTSANVEIPDYVSSIGNPIGGTKIGLPKQFFEGIPDDGMRILNDVMSILRKEGCVFVELDLATIPYSLPVYYVIAPAEASSNLAKFDGIRFGKRLEGEDLEDLYVKTRSDAFGEEVKRRIMIGTYVLSAGSYSKYYDKALKIRKMIKDDFEMNAFSKVDFVLGLTTLGPAFSVSDEIVTKDPIQMYKNDIFTIAANLGGFPAISIPAGLSSNFLPMGVQLIGPKFSESYMFAVSYVIEKFIGFCDLRKKVMSVVD
jgi:aspartyl-tRNA(Asn)/glutamyl-tRNA(Gln) amidotransferase subunit A